jgi:tricorn protease
VSGSYALIDGSEVSMPQQNVVLFQQKSGGGGGGGGNPIENRGVVPDIEVVVSPTDHALGKDPQLDAAVTEALRLLGAAPPPAAPVSAADAPAADQSRAAECERGLSGGRWPFKTWAPYPEDEIEEDSEEDDDDDSSGDDHRRKGGKKKGGPKGGRPRGRP